jgi:hypothetical protein
MSLTSRRQQLQPSVPAGVSLPTRFYDLRPSVVMTLLGMAVANFGKYASALWELYADPDRSKDQMRAQMLTRLKDSMVEGQHYHRAPGGSLQNGRGITLTTAGKNQFLRAGVGDGDAWLQVHVGFADWFLHNHLLILNAFTNPAPDQQYIVNRSNNVNQFNQNVQNIVQDNPKQVARRGDQELLKALTHPDELNIKYNADQSIKSVGLPGGQAKRIAEAAGGDPDNPDHVRRVKQKGTVSSQLTAQAQALENALRAMSDVSNNMNPGGYTANATRVRDNFIQSGALLHKDVNGNILPADQQRLISFNPTYCQTGGARRNGLELLYNGADPAPALPAPVLAAPALPAPAAPLAAGA